MDPFLQYLKDQRAKKRARSLSPSANQGRNFPGDPPCAPEANTTRQKIRTVRPKPQPEGATHYEQRHPQPRSSVVRVSQSSLVSSSSSYTRETVPIKPQPPPAIQSVLSYPVVSSSRSSVVFTQFGQRHPTQQSSVVRVSRSSLARSSESSDDMFVPSPEPGPGDGHTRRDCHCPRPPYIPAWFLDHLPLTVKLRVYVRHLKLRT